MLPKCQIQNHCVLYASRGGCFAFLVALIIPVWDSIQSGRRKTKEGEESWKVLPSSCCFLLTTNTFSFLCIWNLNGKYIYVILVTLQLKVRRNVTSFDIWKCSWKHDNDMVNCREIVWSWCFMQNAAICKYNARNS